MSELGIKAIISAVIALLIAGVGFELGRMSMSKQTTQTQETTKSGEITHTVTTITEQEGKKVTQVIEDAVKHTTSKETTKSSEVLPTKHNALNVSLLGGALLQTRPELVYGLSVSTQAIGPLTTGLFGLSNGIVGLSIGVNF